LGFGPVRGNGWGIKLMTEAERYAVEKAAEASFLDTHSFQARLFYEKLGY
jgi:histone acetyltransferase (RNA polymerase elongator complex component)